MSRSRLQELVTHSSSGKTHPSSRNLQKGWKNMGPAHNTEVKGQMTMGCSSHIWASRVMAWQGKEVRVKGQDGVVTLRGVVHSRGKGVQAERSGGKDSRIRTLDGAHSSSGSPRGMPCPMIYRHQLSSSSSSSNKKEHSRGKEANINNNNSSSSHHGNRISCHHGSVTSRTNCCHGSSSSR